MKRILSVILILAVLGVCGCNKAENNAESDTQNEINTEISATDSGAESDSDSTTEAEVNTETSEKDTEISSESGNPNNKSQNNGQSSTTPPKVSVSNEYLSVKADSALNTNGKVTVTISTKNVASKEIYGLQFSVAFKGMSIESVTKGGLPNGWSCSVTDNESANANGGATVLFDCDFSSALDDRELITIVFKSNGNGALTVSNNTLIQGKYSFTKITGSNIAL